MEKSVLCVKNEREKGCMCEKWDGEGFCVGGLNREGRGGRWMMGKIRKKYIFTTVKFILI